MNSKEKLFRTLSIALLEIRGDANIANDKKTFEIANLVHNLPNILQKEEVNYDLELKKIIDAASNNKGLNDWLKNNSIVV